MNIFKRKKQKTFYYCRSDLQNFHQLTFILNKVARWRAFNKNFAKKRIMINYYNRN